MVAVVVTVSVEVVVPGSVTVAGFRLTLAHVNGLPDGPVTLVQLRPTGTENPPEGETVIVDVLPVSAPALSVMAPLLLSA